MSPEKSTKAADVAVLATRRGGIESWECPEPGCGFFTHGDEQMVRDHWTAEHRDAKPAATADDASLT